MTDVFKGWARISSRLKPLADVLWLFDFDGTLAPIVAHPRLAKIAPPTRNGLRRLVRQFPNRVGVISGRSLADVRRRVHVPELIYGGSHGQEIASPEWRLQRTPSKALRVALQQFTHALDPWVKTVHGLWIETKPWSRCVHFRQIRKSDGRRVRKVLKEARSLAHRLGLRCQPGARSLEIVSPTSWDKGTAVQWLKQRLKARRVFYIGDDTTDESVFRQFRPPNAMVVVGLDRRSQATYYVKSQTQMRRLLERLNSL